MFRKRKTKSFIAVFISVLMLSSLFSVVALAVSENRDKSGDIVLSEMNFPDSQTQEDTFLDEPQKEPEGFEPQGGIPQTFSDEEIVEFSPLSQEVEMQEVPFGTPLEKIIFPAVLNAKTAAQETTIPDVTWAIQSGEGYDGNKAGTYVFVPSLPEGWIVAEGVQLPQIEVAVNEPRTDAINFPDAVFEAVVREKTSIETGPIYPEDVADIDILLMFDKPVTSLEGLQYFTNLKELRCVRGNLEALDVTGLTKLEKLFCNNNKMTGPDKITGLDTSVTTSLTFWPQKDRVTGMGVDVDTLSSTGGDIVVQLETAYAPAGLLVFLCDREKAGWPPIDPDDPGVATDEQGRAIITLPANQTNDSVSYWIRVKEPASGQPVWSGKMVQVSVNAENAPTVAGPSMQMVVTGYEAFSTEPFTITGGIDPVTVSITEADPAFSWNDETKTLDVKAGLTKGSYEVKLAATGGNGVSTTVTYVLQVFNPLSFTGPEELVLVEGYSKTNTESYITDGGLVRHVEITEGNPKISWKAPFIVIEPGLEPGIYPVSLKIWDDLSPEMTFAFTLTVVERLGITGASTMTLAEGYAPTQSEEFTIAGAKPVTVSIAEADPAFSWNAETNQLNIAAGLSAGEYPVILKAVDGVSQNTTFTFVLTVTPQLSIKGSKIMVLPWGYEDTQSPLFTAVGTGDVTLSLASADPAITWNAETNQLNIAAGLNPGEYPVVLKASDAVSDNVEYTFVVKVTPQLVVGGARTMVLAFGYEAAQSPEFTISGTGAISVALTEGNPAITWNAETNQLNIAAGLAIGVYPVKMAFTHESGAKTEVVFTLTVAQEEALVFLDDNFEALVREYCRKPTGPIYQSDVEKITRFYISGGHNVSNLEGLQYFTNLTHFEYNGGPVTSMDFSGNPNLKEIIVMHSPNLTHVTASNLSHLKDVKIHYTNVETIDVSNSISLVNLEAVTIINTNLKNIYVEGCSSLSSLVCRLSKLTSLDCSTLPSLTRLIAVGDEMEFLLLPPLSNLQLVETSGAFTTLDVSGCPDLETLFVRAPNLAAIDLSLNSSLKSLEVVGQLTDLNLSAQTKLENLRVNDNQLTVLDISNNPNLITLHASNNKLQELDLSLNSQLTRLSVDRNQLTSLDLQAQTKLSYLNASSNELDTLDLSAQSELTELLAYYNKLTFLDVSGQTKLERLELYANYFTSPDKVVGRSSSITQFIFWGQLNRINKVTVSPESIPGTGGEITITVDANYVPAGIKVSLQSVYGLIEGITDENGNCQMTIPENPYMHPIMYQAVAVETSAEFPNNVYGNFIHIESGTYPPAITGPVAHRSVVGYTAFSIESFDAVGGTAPLTIEKVSGQDEILWNSATKQLDIPAGLPLGNYPIELKATDSSGRESAIYTFTFSVVPPLSFSGPDTLSLIEGYEATQSEAFSYTGAEPVTVRLQPGSNPAITWNNETNKLNIDEGLAAGDYPVTLMVFDGVSENILHTVVIQIIPKLGIRGPQSMTLPEGYASAHSGQFTINGVPPVLVTKVSGNDAITWNPDTSRLDILAGLETGEYPVVLQASDEVSEPVQHTFTLFVKSQLGITGPSSLALPAGYQAVQSDVFTLTGVEPIQVSIVEGANPAITWNSQDLTIDIAAGLDVGVYNLVLEVSDSSSDPVQHTFTLRIEPQLSINGPRTKIVVEGYDATQTEAYTLTGAIPVTVSIKQGANPAISWNQTDKKLDIAAGLPTGEYPVTLLVSDGVSADVSHDFTLLVKPVLSVSGPHSMKVAEGYGATQSEEFTLTGAEPIRVSIEPGANPAISWNNAAKRLDIAPGLPIGEYSVSLIISDGVSEQINHSFTLWVKPMPSISGPTAITQIEGYDAIRVDGFIIKGLAPVAVTLTPENLGITWDNDENCLNIAAGMAPGSYSVQLTAADGDNEISEVHTFTLTVVAKLAITGPEGMTLIEGYDAISSDAFSIVGASGETVNLSPQIPAISWNSQTKRLDIAPGLEAGTYPIQITVTNAAPWQQSQITFTLQVKPALTIAGPVGMTVIEGYTATQTPAFTITGVDPVTVSLKQGVDPGISWNQTDKKLDIASGSAGRYVVTLFASDGVSPSIETTFTLLVEPQLSITGDQSISLTAGYPDTKTSAFTLQGAEPVTVFIASGNPSITWDAASRTLNIAAGLEVGEYPIELHVSDGLSPDITFVFTVSVVPAPTQYVIVYHANGGTGEMANGSIADDGTHTVMDCAFTHTLEFKEWNTQADGSGTSYQPGDIYTLTTAFNGNASVFQDQAGILNFSAAMMSSTPRDAVQKITLYAQWKQTTSSSEESIVSSPSAPPQEPDPAPETPAEQPSASTSRKPATTTSASSSSTTSSSSSSSVSASSASSSASTSSASQKATGVQSESTNQGMAFQEKDTPEVGTPEHYAIQNEETLKTLDEKGVPKMNLGGTQVPLYGTMSSKVWSLMNLIIAIISAVFGAMLVIMQLLPKARAQQKSSRQIKYLIAAAATGLFSAIVFFVTQNMKQLMVVLDKWSVVFILLLVLQFVLWILSGKREGSKQDISS